MKTISKGSDNMGGVIRMWAVPPGDVTVSGKTVTINSDSNMIEIQVKEDSASFTENGTDSFAGNYFKTEISGVVPCDQENTLSIIKEMETRLKYLVIYRDGNGNFKLAGTRDVPLRFSAKHDTGKGAASLNNYEISFSGAQKDRAVFINNPFS
jgi:hypothetical protein